MTTAAHASPSTTARLAGLLYLVSIVARIVADGAVRDRLIVPGDAALTARNILANESLFRAGFLAELVALATFLAVTALLYRLFAPVSRTLSLTAVFFSLVACITQAVSSFFQLAALYTLGRRAALKAFDGEQLDALASILLRMRSILFHNVGLVFLGLFCILVGYAIVRSAFVPKLIGVLFALAGLAYLPFAWPPLAASLLPYILPPVGIGQLALAFWLLVKGVRADRWNAVAENHQSWHSNATALSQ